MSEENYEIDDGLTDEERAAQEAEEGEGAEDTESADLDAAKPDDKPA